jgi:hypothetical protein
MLLSIFINAESTGGIEMSTEFRSENLKVKKVTWTILLNWEDDIRMNLRKIDWESVDYIRLSQDSD